MLKIICVWLLGFMAVSSSAYAQNFFIVAEEGGVVKDAGERGGQGDGQVLVNLLNAHGTIGPGEDRPYARIAFLLKSDNPVAKSCLN